MNTAEEHSSAVFHMLIKHYRRDRPPCLSEKFIKIRRRLIAAPTVFFTIFIPLSDFAKNTFYCVGAFFERPKIQ